MEGFNWWGLFSFVIPIAVAITIGLVVLIASILYEIRNFIKRIRR